MSHLQVVQRSFAAVSTTATLCCTVCQTAFFGRSSRSRTPPHVWSPGLVDEIISRRRCVNCTDFLFVDELTTCLVLADQTLVYLADDIQLVTDTDRCPLRSAAAGHASFQGCITVSVTEVLVPQARVCGTAGHRTYNKTQTSRIFSINWKHFCDCLLFCTTEILLVTYLPKSINIESTVCQVNFLSEELRLRYVLFSFPDDSYCACQWGRASVFFCQIKWCWVPLVCRVQWCRLQRARGYVPPLLQMAGHAGTVSRRTANKNWPNCTDHHESAHQND